MERFSCELYSKLLKVGLGVQGLGCGSYSGVLQGLLRGILAVYTIAHGGVGLCYWFWVGVCRYF